MYFCQQRRPSERFLSRREKHRILLRYVQRRSVLRKPHRDSGSVPGIKASIERRPSFKEIRELGPCFRWGGRRR